jgi:SAM-dependent methyltransferase
MFTESGELYDLIYRQFKDYREESKRVAELLSRRMPTARTVLDVACGTGEHARHLEESGFSVDGVDVERAFVELAAAKNPKGRFVCQDMVELEMGRTYDAVLCLFSSIGYVLTEERLRSAVQRFADHAVDGGIVVVEPWFQPGDMEDGYLGMHTAETEDVKVCRMARTRLIEGVSRIEFEYLVGRREGVERFSEVHELALFTRAQMEQTLHEASLEIEYDPEGLFGRGLYVCRKPAS